MVMVAPGWLKALVAFTMRRRWFLPTIAQLIDGSGPSGSIVKVTTGSGSGPQPRRRFAAGVCDGGRRA
jgi:hypothetical protein